ncbi:MAG: hypothetical protein MHM6MM_000790 [Cercozoa sp. M6MM]
MLELARAKRVILASILCACGVLYLGPQYRVSLFRHVFNDKGHESRLNGLFSLLLLLLGASASCLALSVVWHVRSFRHTCAAFWVGLCVGLTPLLSALLVVQGTILLVCTAAVLPIQQQRQVFATPMHSPADTLLHEVLYFMLVWPCALLCVVALLHKVLAMLGITEKSKRALSTLACAFGVSFVMWNRGVLSGGFLLLLAVSLVGLSRALSHCSASEDDRMVSSAWFLSCMSPLLLAVGVVFTTLHRSLSRHDAVLVDFDLVLHSAYVYEDAAMRRSAVWRCGLAVAVLLCCLLVDGAALLAHLVTSFHCVSS